MKATIFFVVLVIAYSAADETAETAETSDTVEELARRCPQNYHHVGHGCYYLPDVSYSWFNASNFCLISGGYLAKIDNAREERYLRPFLEAHDNASMPRSQIYVSRWIGATDSLNEGTYIWVPSGAPLDFQNWYPNYPWSTAWNRDCVYWFHPGNYWINDDCVDFFNIAPLCEADPLR